MHIPFNSWVKKELNITKKKLHSLADVYHDINYTAKIKFLFFRYRETHARLY